VKQRLILASGSPRRTEIFRQNGLDPEIRIPRVKEIFPQGISVESTVMYLALLKALAIEKEIHQGFIVSADTVVYNGRILGKPIDERDALNMLKELRGKAHWVLTGVAIIDGKTQNRRVFYEATEVYFTRYSIVEMEEYIKTGEPLDKAGAYALQGEWGRHIHRVVGNRDNVIGFPWERGAKELREMGYMGV
jgi:septum formation protein